MNKIKLIALAGLLALTTILPGCSNTEEAAAERQETIEAEQENSQAIDNTISYKGKKYVYNENLTNILFLGIDTTDRLDVDKLPGDNGQSDCIMLLSLDKSKKQARILQINRNTMIDIDFYNRGGTVDYSEKGQITLQYACAPGSESSAWATKKAVRELLYGLTIDAYLAMDLSAIDEINDALGGIDITMPKDYTNIDESFIEGETVHLEGGLAQRYVRYRDINEFNSVADRMSRQVDYVTAMIDVMKSGGHGRLYDVLSPYLDKNIITDMNADQLNALTDYKYLTDKVDYLPGKETMGEVYEEYIVDEEATQDMVIRNYYVEVKE